MKRQTPSFALRTAALACTLIAAFASCSDSRRPSQATTNDLLREWPAIAGTLHAAAKNASTSRLKATMPAHADDALELALPGSDAPLRIKRRGASHALGVLDRGVVVYADTGPTAALLVATSDAVEELLVVRERLGAITYDLELPASFTLREIAPRIVEIVDRGGRARLRVSAPRGWDASGAELGLALDVREKQLELRVTGSGPLPWLLDPLWTTTKGLITARSRHTATLLASGEIFVAGGDDGAQALASSELYDPATGTVTAAAKLASPREDHTATLLRNGLVLIAGGTSSSIAQATTSAELYDPESGAVSALSPMATPRTLHTATLLGDGRVLVAGGTASPVAAEIFDPATKKFTSTGKLVVPRKKHTATRLLSGEVLLVGGVSTDNGILASPVVETFNPVTGTFAPVPAALSSRVDHTATLFADHKVLLAGGGQTDAELYDTKAGTIETVSVEDRHHHAAALLPSDSVMLAGGFPINLVPGPATLELVDPASKIVQKADALGENRRSFTTTLLPSGDVIMIGGELIADQGVAPRPLRSLETYTDETGGSITLTATLPAAVTGLRLTALLDGRVVASGGGSTGTGTTSTSLDIFDPALDAFTSHKTMSVARSEHTATLLSDGRVLLAGGAANGAASAELFDGVTTTTVTMRTARTKHAAVRLSSGKVLLIGSDVTGTTELFDPATGTFTFSGSMSEPRTLPTATLLLDGRVLVAGGADPSAQHIRTAEIYDPTTGKFQVTGPMAAARQFHAAALLPSGRVLVAGGAGDMSAELYDPVTSTFEPTGSLMTLERTALSATLLPSGKVLLLGGVHGPTDATPDELYDPKVDRFFAAPGSTFGLSHHAAVLLSTGEVLAAGGVATPSFFPSAECVRYSSNKLVASSTRRPTIATAPSAAAGGDRVALAGTLLAGAFEAAGGTTASSPSDNPVAIWMPVSGGLVAGGIAPWTASSATWNVRATALSGPGLLFVGTSGELSNAKLVSVAPGASGAACLHDLDCASLHCTDGVCCNTVCKDLCSACSAAALGGTTSGICRPVPPATDPRGECLREPVTTCGRAGGCDGAGSCAKYTNGTMCDRGATCAAGKCTARVVGCIDDATFASADGTKTSCAPFRCLDGACRERCKSTSDCIAGLQCTAQGDCAPLPADDASSQGCLCGVAAGRGGPSPALPLVLAALLLATATLRNRRPS